jgi:16S rRNA (adenine1518-N6/adenine1519-N6)-dimethyltransferase
MTRDARGILREAGLRPKKSFGQNFLVAPGVAEQIATAAVPDAERGGDTTVVEIGAGTGALTSALLARGAHVVAIERDRDLVPLLRDTFASEIAAGELELVEADAKTFDYASVATPFVLCGNLPYQLTGPLLERATALTSAIRRAVFMVQREVADRLVAKPETKEYGALTVFVRAAFAVEVALRVKPGSFFPPPDVTSAVVVLTPRADRIPETPRFRALVHAAFEQRRKTLRNAWGSVAERAVIEHAAAACAIALERRGETLSEDEFGRMAAALTP